MGGYNHTKQYEIVKIKTLGEGFYSIHWGLGRGFRGNLGVMTVYPVHTTRMYHFYFLKKKKKKKKYVQFR